MMMLLPSDTFPPYKLKNGTAVVGNKTVTIKDNVITVSNKKIDAYNVNGYLNVSNLAQNGNDEYTTNNVINKPKIFTIPAGAVCVLTLNGKWSAAASYEYWKLMLYEAESTNMIKSTPWSYGWAGGSFVDTVEWTQASAVDVGSICLMSSHLYNSYVLTATISLTVNGEKWV